jgi:hypothetical protein
MAERIPVSAAALLPPPGPRPDRLRSSYQGLEVAYVADHTKGHFVLKAVLHFLQTQSTATELK